MTAVLDELRRLNAARQRGDITEREFSLIRASLENDVEDARVIEGTLVSKTAATQPDKSPDTASDSLPEANLWHIFVFMLLVFTVGTAFIAWLINDVTIALTLAATVLAAISVHAAQKLKD